MFGPVEQSAQEQAYKAPMPDARRRSCVAVEIGKLSFVWQEPGGICEETR